MSLSVTLITALSPSGIPPASGSLSPCSADLGSSHLPLRQHLPSGRPPTPGSPLALSMLTVASAAMQASPQDLTARASPALAPTSPPRKEKMPHFRQRSPSLQIVRGGGAGRGGAGREGRQNSFSTRPARETQPCPPGFCPGMLIADFRSPEPGGKGISVVLSHPPPASPPPPPRTPAWFVVICMAAAGKARDVALESRPLLQGHLRVADERRGQSAGVWAGVPCRHIALQKCRDSLLAPSP